MILSVDMLENGICDDYAEAGYCSSFSTDTGFLYRVKIVPYW